MVGWYYKLKEEREPEFIKIWLKYFPEHANKCFTKSAAYGIDLNSQIKTLTHPRSFDCDCIEIQLSELENRLKSFFNKEITYELW
jgi:hypothetical protein